MFLGTIGKNEQAKLRLELEACRLDSAWAPTDSILIVPVHQSQVRNIHAIGQWPNRWQEIAGELNTLMI